MQKHNSTVSFKDFNLTSAPKEPTEGAKKQSNQEKIQVGKESTFVNKDIKETLLQNAKTGQERK